MSLDNSTSTSSFYNIVYKSRITILELLAKQGSHKKAIQMYKRLSLIFPKKSSFFAKKIAKLKK